MTASLDALLDEHAELERALADPSVHADAAHARKLGRRYAEIGPVVAAARELAAARADEAAARRARGRRPDLRRRGPRSSPPHRPGPRGAAGRAARPA